MSVTPPNSAVLLHRFRRRVPVRMTYGDGRHTVSSIDDVRTSRLAPRNDEDACGQNYFA
jgi:hypothetical protein